MADFLHVVGTLDSDDEDFPLVNEEEDDKNEELSSLKGRKKKKKKQNNQSSVDFDSNFSFSIGGDSHEQVWKIDSSIKNRAKGSMPLESIEEKIKSKRKERKKIAKSHSIKKECEDIIDDKDRFIEFMEDEKNQDLVSVSVQKDENYINDSEDDSDEDNEEIDEELDHSNSDVDEDEKPFFVLPPPQVKHKHFGQMNLSRPILRAVNELGFVHPTKIQSATIPVALLGKDVCACATTGSGKTAAFILPILERLLFKPKQSVVIRVLVLVPTRELAIQVHSVSQSLAKYTDVQICLAAGGLDSKIQEALLRKSPDIVIATPGRLIDHLHNTPSFNLQTIEILVLDEADRMLEEHFKDQMEELIRMCPRGRQTMLFSATMTDQVEQLISLSLNHPTKIFVDQNTDVASNLQQEFIRIRAARESDRLAIVAALCCRSFHDHTLVFLQTKRLAHKLRIILGLFGLTVAELHGDLSQLQRLDALEKYKNNMVDILVATDLAARGLDIAGVKTVISYNMPSTIKSYIHRVGRTARAGKGGRSITLVGEKERKLLKEVVKNSTIPVKNRIVPPEVISRFQKKLDEMEKDIKDLLKQEEEEKEFRIAEMHANKARNLIVHHDEIMSRPARTFIKPQKQQQKATTKKRKTSEMSAEEKSTLKEQSFMKRQIKKVNRPKRMRACEETSQELKRSKGSKKPKLIPSKSSFDRDLTDTSRKNIKSLRRSATNIPKKKKAGGGFKSKSKHKRKH